MSHRREDEGIIEYLRNLENRVKRLEGGDKGVRQNTLRLGNMVLEADNDNSRIGIRNVKTGGDTKWLPEKRETFGWVGLVALGEPNDNISPPAQIFNTLTMVEVVLQVITPTTVGDITAILRVLDPERTLVPGCEFTMTIPEGKYYQVYPQMLLLTHGHSMYVELIDAGDETATNLSLTVRFDG